MLDSDVIVEAALSVVLVARINLGEDISLRAVLLAYGGGGGGACSGLAITDLRCLLGVLSLCDNIRPLFTTGDEFNEWEPKYRSCLHNTACCPCGAEVAVPVDVEAQPKSLACECVFSQLISSGAVSL